MNKTLTALVVASFVIASPLAVAGVYDDILFAANQSETAKVVDLLRRGMDVNTADQQGMTLLMIAAREKNLELVRFLLDNRANAQRKNRYGDTALMLATLQGHEEIVHLMLERKVDPNQPGWNALHYAAFENRTKIAALLLAAGANANAVAPNGSTALMLAAKRGHLETVRLLVGAQAELNQIDNEEGTALDMATQAKHVAVADFLRRAGAR
ncbi:MAG: ankyrin repeat domain-containing protein [Burkholderiales bacterium]|nr:ankyrin repeat domain-containing protein [Burkholderiales bacterium]